MKRHLVMAIALPAFALTSALPASAQSWLFNRSTFSHDPATGARVNQYAAKRVAYVPADGTYLQSGYRHMRFGLRAGGSADRLHVVQTWGAGEAIRPYGEWQFPFRAGATPYGPWGNSQGPWTMPYDSWVNPYGQWNRYPNLPGGQYFPGGAGYPGRPGYSRPFAPGHASPYGPTPYAPTPHSPGPPGPGHP